jgi:hypothetical protein
MKLYYNTMREDQKVMLYSYSKKPKKEYDECLNNCEGDDVSRILAIFTLK